MAYKFRRKILSQNFLYNRALISKLVRESSLGQNDTVLEIGPGKGLITSELLEVSKRVIAVEVDPKLVLHLEKFFGDNPKLDLYFADILDFHLPRTKFKVFANIPFSIEGKIIRKLLEDKNPPEDCYLVIRKDLAERLSGLLGNNQFSIKFKPWFDFSLYYHFKRDDFIPKPSMDCVMWRITKKQFPLILSDQKLIYQKFIERGFGDGLSVKRNLRKYFNAKYIDQLQKRISFSLDVQPNSLSFEQWLNLYKISTNYK